MSAIIAIDPGASGGIAWYLTGNPLIPTQGCKPMPDTERDILDQLQWCTGCGQPITAFIEENTGYTGVKIPSHTMFKLGRNTGFVHGCLQSLGFRIETVRPQEWQRELGLGTSKGLTKTEWKNKLKAKAQQLYPSVKVTLATADALLLLEYGKRKATHG